MVIARSMIRSSAGRNQSAPSRPVLVGDLADVAFEANLAACKQPQRLRVDAMLDAEDALRQRLGRVVIGHRDRALHHDRPGVGFRDHEMHGRA